MKYYPKNKISCVSKEVWLKDRVFSSLGNKDKFFFLGIQTSLQFINQLTGYGSLNTDVSKNLTADWFRTKFYIKIKISKK